MDRREQVARLHEALAVPQATAAAAPTASHQAELVECVEDAIIKISIPSNLTILSRGSFKGCGHFPWGPTGEWSTKLTVIVDPVEYDEVGGEPDRANPTDYAGLEVIADAYLERYEAKGKSHRVLVITPYDDDDAESPEVNAELKFLAAGRYGVEALS